MGGGVAGYMCVRPPINGSVELSGNFSTRVRLGRSSRPVFHQTYITPELIMPGAARARIDHPNCSDLQVITGAIAGLSSSFGDARGGF